MKISVLVTLYNKEKFIKKCIDSIPECYEIIVCDDCSTDDSVNIVKSVNRKELKLIQNKKNMKCNYTYNRCLDEATGDYIIILDADDYFLPEMEEVFNLVDGKYDMYYYDILANNGTRIVVDNNNQYEFGGNLKLTRRKFIGNIRYPLKGIGDKEFTRQLLDKKPTIKRTGILAYYYNRQPDGVLSNYAFNGIDQFSAPSEQATLCMYQFHFCEVGGVETAVYNLCSQLRDWYDITLLYESGDSKQISRLKRIVKVELYDKNKQYYFDLVLRDSIYGQKPTNIHCTYNKYIQRLHADFEWLKKYNNINYNDKKWDKTTDLVACGEFVAKQFEKVYGIKPVVIKNILDEKKEVNKIYRFILAGRMTDEKGFDLVKQFMKMTKNAGMITEWTFITDSFIKFEFENMHIHVLPPRFDIFDYIADATYGLLLSKAEGLPYFLQECLQYGTPCIVTDIGGCTELIQDGVNGYVVPLDMNFDINKIKNIPKVKNYDNGVTPKTWCDFLGHAKYIKKESYKEKKDMRYLVEALKTYEEKSIEDGVLKRIPEVGEQFEVDKERLEVLLGDNPYKVAFVKLVKEIKEEAKDNNKEDKPKTTTKKKVTKKK